MGSLLAEVLPLALGAAISPVVLTVQVLNLARGRSSRSWAIVAGSATALAILGAIVLVASDQAPGAGSGHPGMATGVVKLVLAGLLLVLAARAVLVHPSARHDLRPDDAPPRLGRYFMIGILLMATNLTSLVLFVPALHDVAISAASVCAQVVAVTVVVVIVLAPAYLPPLAVTMLGDGATRALDAVNTFLVRHQRAVTVAICVGFSALLAMQGVAALD